MQGSRNEFKNRNELWHFRRQLYLQTGRPSRLKNVRLLWLLSIMHWTRRELAQAKSTHLAADGLDHDHGAEFVVQPLRQIHQVPADNVVRSRDWTALDDTHQSLALVGIEEGRRSGRLARYQALRTIDVEAHDPHNVRQAHAARPNRKPFQELCVAKAVAKIGARAETDPSMRPTSPCAVISK